MSYPSDLTDEQWESIRKHVPKARSGGRPRSTDVRHVIRAMFYLCRTGCSWRYLPKHFPPWQTVFMYFSQWQRCGFWKALHELLVRKERVQQGRDPVPRVLIVDSQSVRAPLGKERGYDGFKRLRGRKRQILVDTQGLIHAVLVHRASIPDQSGGIDLLRKYPHAKQSRLEVIYADRGYRGAFVEHAQLHFGIKPRIPPSRPNSGQGKKKLTREKLRDRNRRRAIPKKRWVVERTFSWMNFFRRFSKDYERKPTTSEGMIYLGMIQFLLRRLLPLRE